LGSAGFDPIKAVDQDSLGSRKRIDNAVCLRNDGMAQESKAIAKSAGRILGVTLESYELCSGVSIVFKRISWGGRKGMSMSKYAVGFYQ
jgi:hypothetical protein